MTKEEAEQLLGSGPQGVAQWNLAREDEAFSLPALTQLRLAGADLGGANLADANLAGADLSGTDLSHANLAGADLSGANLRDAVLVGASLRDATLNGVTGFRARQLAMTDVCGAVLPDAIARFEVIGIVAEASKNCRTLFLSTLAVCAYMVMTAASVKDVDLLVGSRSFELPLVAVEVSLTGFFAVGPAVLLGVFIYFQFYLHMLCQRLATLPTILHDGRRGAEAVYPWLLNSIFDRRALSDGGHRFLRAVQTGFAYVLAWFVVPVTLFYVWWTYLPRHDVLLSAVHVAFVVVAIASALGFASSTRYVLRLTEFATASAIVAAVVAGVAGAGMSWALHCAADASCTAVGASLDLRNQKVASVDKDWKEKEDPDFNHVRPLELKGRNLAKVRASDAFLPRSRLACATVARGKLSAAALQFADLSFANLHGVFLEGADLRGATLTGAILTGAKLRWAKLPEADLRGADLRGADLSFADLRDTNVAGANFEGANLGGARNLTRDQMERACGRIGKGDKRPTESSPDGNDYTFTLPECDGWKRLACGAPLEVAPQADDHDAGALMPWPKDAGGAPEATPDAGGPLQVTGPERPPIGGTPHAVEAPTRPPDTAGPEPKAHARRSGLRVDPKSAMLRGPGVRFSPSPNQSNEIEQRFVVLHFNAQTYESTARFFQNPARKASSHLLISRGGEILQLVGFNARAWHAGKSEFEGLSGLNRYSIGITLENWGQLKSAGSGWATWSGLTIPPQQVFLEDYQRGAEPRAWQQYTDTQLDVLEDVLHALKRAYPSLTNVLTHEEISPRRKRDPGPAFPMRRYRRLFGGQAQQP